MQRIILDTNPSQRYEDANGFLCIKHNPIAKAGVFEYLGESLGMTGNDARRIYKVYRPFDELVKTAKEFEGMPITLDHHWVEGDSTNPTVMGIISGRVTAEEPYLYADIKIINDEARKAIESGEMRELSPGYTSQFEEENGEYNGEEYNFKQFDMHYNHLALVDVGRSGPDLKIVDSANKIEDNINSQLNNLLNLVKASANNLMKALQQSKDQALQKDYYIYHDELNNLYDNLKDYLSNENWAHNAEGIIDNMSTMLDVWNRLDFKNDNKATSASRKLLSDLKSLKNKCKSLNIFDKAGGAQMRRKLKIEDVDIDKLSRLLVDFFNEEKEEGVHNEDEDDVMVDIPSEDEDIITEDETGEDDVMVDVPSENEDEVMIDIPTNAEDEDDIMIDVPSKDEDDVIVDVPSEDEDDVIVDVPSEDEDVAEIANKTVDAAIKSYKREHAKAMAAYDEVTPLVGAFKTYDSAGNTMSEKAIYKFACKRLGLDKVEGISDYKSAFRAANFIQNKIGKSAPSEAKRFNDTAEDDELLTVDEIIKAAFRN